MNSASRRFNEFLRTAPVLRVIVEWFLPSCHCEEYPDLSSKAYPGRDCVFSFDGMFSYGLRDRVFCPECEIEFGGDVVECTECGRMLKPETPVIFRKSTEIFRTATGDARKVCMLFPSIVYFPLRSKPWDDLPESLCAAVVRTGEADDLRDLFVHSNEGVPIRVADDPSNWTGMSPKECEPYLKEVRRAGIRAKVVDEISPEMHDVRKRYLEDLRRSRRIMYSFNRTQTLREKLQSVCREIHGFLRFPR